MRKKKQKTKNRKKRTTKIGNESSSRKMESKSKNRRIEEEKNLKVIGAVQARNPGRWLLEGVLPSQNHLINEVTYVVV